LEREKYPLRLDPTRKQIIWGGRRLIENYGIPFDGENLAEAWVLSVHPEGTNTIINGPHAGITLGDYLGIDANTTDFGIMIKLIDAADRLSIQVHPVKTELWYVMDAEPGATLVYGLKDKFDEQQFRAALADGTVQELLNYVPVKPGDVFFIPQGLVHAIGAGILIAEIQQNSNVTYRVYDYNRRQKDGSLRQLHVDEAMGVIRDFSHEQIEALRFSTHCKRDESLLASCELFRVNRYKLDGTLEYRGEPGEFANVLCLSGDATLTAYGKTEQLAAGYSYFVPADFGTLEISGRAEVIVTASK
jgi:mannose-6-phosphate isomerase class I